MAIPSFSILKGTTNGSLNHDPKFIHPTVDTKKPHQILAQFHNNPTINNDKSLNNNSNHRFLHPFELKEQVNYKVRIPNFTNLPPLQLGCQYISELNKVDSVAPSDLYYNEINKPDGLDSYIFDYENGLGQFSRFEKINQLNLPDKFFDEYNTAETKTKLGLFSEIERSWIIVDNKLVLWNYKIPQSSFNTSSQFLSIDQVRHSILTVKLVKPKPGIFIKEINWLLLVATTQDIHIFIIKYDSITNNLEIFNPDLSVNTHGLIVDNFAINNKNDDVYFTGSGDGINIWKLNYSNKSTFTKNRCEKVCLTKTGLSSVIPNKLPGMDLFNYDKTTTNIENLPESITQLVVDSERDFLYSLSNKSTIRVYKLQPKLEQLTEASKLVPSQIMKQLSSLFVDSANAKVLDRFTIIKLEVISPQESAAIQLIAITSYGCRILLKLGSNNFGYSFNSFASSSRLGVASIKFPPATEAPIVNPELDSFAKSKQHIQQSIANQQKSLLLKGTKIAKIISPGVFLCVKSTKRSDKLFISTVNYGVLKKKNKFIEDAEFLKYISFQNSTSYTYIHDIIQITPSMNATNTPSGYANILASQYTKELLRFAILTNFGIIIYQYKPSDEIIKSLNDETLEYFMDDNGEEETCSTLLYLSCSNSYFNSGDIFRRKAQMLFATCGNNARVIDRAPTVHSSLPGNQNLQAGSQDSHPTVDQVVLSDRFYGTCLLISRLFRDFWDRNVFVPLPYIKLTSTGSVESASVKNDNLIVQGLNIDRKQVEFFIGSINVLNEFFTENGNNILGLNAPNFSSDPSQFENEVSLRAEHIAFSSMLKSLQSMKEALSLLAVLIDETQTNVGTFKYLTLTNQVNLLSLSFKDILLPISSVKNLIKELLSSIINQSILRGGSIDAIASSLQGRCASFCSTDDILIFKALESLTKAKNIGSRDTELKLKCLKTTVTLFEKAHETLTYENVSNATNIMIELQFYAGAVDMLLKLAAKVGNRKVMSHQYEYLPMKSSNELATSNSEVNTRKIQLYGLIFDVLIQVDLEALRVAETNNQLKVSEFTEIRDNTYETCFSSNDKDFHYHFYQWFIDQGVKERLLEINTPYILPFLEERSHNDLGMSDLLWLNFAKKENYFEAANILYGLALSQFELKLPQRIEYLARANGFCNCVCPPNVRQKMIQLSVVVQELFEVGNVQLDLLGTIEKDNRISKENKNMAVKALDNKILTISELFNAYADPLGYYDLCLIIFKTSDYKNTDDILKRWELYFEKLYYQFQVMQKNNHKKEPFYIILNKSLCALGVQLSSNDLVFPIDELIRLISKYNNQAAKEFPSSEQPPKGFLVDLFIDSGVTYDKLYYIMKSLIEHNTFEIYKGFTKNIESNEMVYLIQKWYSEDKKLRDFVDSENIKNLKTYTLDNDPISNYVKNNGIIL
jgi:nuclear pore complex protein Nup155